MALQLTHTVNGVTMTDAYHKVEYVSGSKDNLTVNVAISATSSDAKMDEFSFKMESGDLSHDDGANDKNYIKQAYEFLKAGPITDTMDEARDLSSAIDV